jgi:hypothetical protein
MHDRTRRMLCRAGFLALCVLPTLGVLAWSNSRASPSHSADRAAELSRELGLHVSLAGVSYPQPGAALYEGVELADPETSAPLARMRFLESGGGGSVTALVASQPEVDALQLGRLWHVVAERMQETNGPQPTIRLAAREATLDWPTGSQTLTDVLGELDAKSGSDNERVATIGFHLAGSDAPEPIRIRYSRRVANSHVSSQIEIHTGVVAVPCSLLTVPVGIANRLGERARFRGSLWATETADGWSGELTGEFTEVDLQTAIAEQFPHHLSGTASITIQTVRFRGGRLEEARGTLVAAQGVVGQSLLSSAARHLQLSGTAGGDSNSALVPYDQLAFLFEIDSTGLTIRGQCDRPPGAIFSGGGKALLAESSGSSGYVVALLRTLVPQSEVQVPATRESDWLMRRLPVPQVVPPAGEPPQGKLRLAPQGPG